MSSPDLYGRLLEIKNSLARIYYAERAVLKLEVAQQIVDAHSRIGILLDYMIARPSIQTPPPKPKAKKRKRRRGK